MLECFLDPVLRAPTLGSMLMGFSSGLIGCLVFLKKRSLIGEALSHSAYPGVVLGVIFAATFFPNQMTFCILLGAFFSSILGLLAIHGLERKIKISSDGALCFILSIFFGIGVLISSGLQVSHALWLREIQVFLYGQAATMLDEHILLYGALTIAMIVGILLLFRFLQILYFDSEFAKTVGVPIKLIQIVTSFLLVLAIIIGMRSVGVVLMSAMLIAPAVAARAWSKTLHGFLFLSGLFGLLAGYLGNGLSIWVPIWAGDASLSLPTGPMIVLSATSLSIFSLLFAPDRGFIFRLIRKGRFQLLCKQENALKALYKGTFQTENSYILWRMKRKGWMQDQLLTSKGRKEAEKLIRLHRLWEVYLVHMGQGSDQVHHSAEEMEHILTPEIEKQLQTLLRNPSKDPHEQPIPKGSL